MYNINPKERSRYFYFNDQAKASIESVDVLSASFWAT